MSFKNAIKKYGKENFAWETLIEVESNELDYYEQKYILEYKSNQKEFGYNIREGGKTGKFNEETRKKMSESAKKYFSDPEIAKKKIDHIHDYLKKHPDVEKMRSEKIRKTCSMPENKKKNSDRKKEYFINHPEAGKEHSDKLKITFSDPKYRESASKRTIEYFSNPENREKARQKSIEQFSNPNNREAASQRTKEFLSDPENKRKKIETLIDYYSIRENRIKMSRARGGKPFVATKGDETLYFDLQSEAAKQLNIHQTHISLVLLGKSKTAKGWKFSYMEQ